ncbi:MAG: hypothetical protein VB934_04550 [Polyangiaceae bacterium]
MLDPELLDHLAAQPGQNAPDINVALAEQGHGGVLLALVRSGATGPDALAVVAQRVVADRKQLAVWEPEEGESEAVVDVLDQHLICHPNTPAAARDTVLARHPADAFFVLAASCHIGATETAVERAASWPSRYPVLDRPWLALIMPGAVSPLTYEAWAQDECVLRRELVARLTFDSALLEILSGDADRRVRRAVASNPRAAKWRERLATSDSAVEVRARAKRPLGTREDKVCAVDSPRFAAALRALESGGVLAPDVAAALGMKDLRIDEEGAARAAQVLPGGRVIELLPFVLDLPGDHPAARGFSAGFALRRAAHGAGLGEMIGEAAKALSLMPAGVASSYTGKARLAAWASAGLAASTVLDAGEVLDHLADHSLASDTMVLRRGLSDDASRVAALCRACRSTPLVPPGLLAVAWATDGVADEEVIEMAKRVSRVRARGRDLPEDEMDLDPSLRSLDVLEKVVLAASKKVVFSPRCALSVVALDARRVRYVMTAMPQWKGRLSGAMLMRVLRQNAGALSAAPAEARERLASVRPWTERVLTDIELSLALGVGHITTTEVVHRFRLGRHRVDDGETLACGADVRATIEGRRSIRPLLTWAAEQRQSDPAALATWLLLESHDRPRTPSMIAASIDSFAARQLRVPEALSCALACLENRKPGRFEVVFPQTPRGKATLVSAIARAYCAVGGTR